MKYILTIIFLFSTTILLAGTWEFVYKKTTGDITRAERVTTGPSVIPHTESRRLTQAVVRVENAPIAWDTLNFFNYKVNPTVLGSCTIIIQGQRVVATSTTLYQGPNGNLIEYNSVNYSDGLIEPK